MLADNDMDLQTARLHIWHTAWLLDQGARGSFESSRAKVVCSEAEWRVVDRCVQILGGQGVTGETIVMRIFMRHARLPHLRRPERSAPLEHGAAHRRRREEARLRALAGRLPPGGPAPCRRPARGALQTRSDATASRT